MAQGIDAIFEILQGSLRGGQEGCLIFALADEGLSGQVHTFTPPLGLGGFLFSKLNGAEMILNHLVFAGLDGTVGRVYGATRGLDENGVNPQAGALGTNAGDHITNRDGSSVRTIQEMPGSNGVGANLIEDLVLPLPRGEERSRRHDDGAC